MSRTSTGSTSPREPVEAAPAGPPVSPRDVERLLEELGVRPSRRLGQSFLADPFVADAEAALALPAPGATVVEVGGGLGILTAALVRRGPAALTVVERDRRLARFLGATFGAPVRVQAGDALRVPLGTPQVLVGNLPFSVATPILLRAFEERVPRVVALVQREVAERLAAGPGSRTYGRLSIIAALYGTVELFQVVPSASFVPPPAVEGRLIGFTARSGPLPVPSVPALEHLLARLFSGRRKQLGNLLPRVLGPGEPPAEIARASGWPDGWERRRPEELPPEAFFRLAVELGSRGGQTAPRQV